MYIIHVNLEQFQERWIDYSDNIFYSEAIRKGKGVVTTLDPRTYYDWLTTFNIFFTGGQYKPPIYDGDLVK